MVYVHGVKEIGQWITHYNLEKTQKLIMFISNKPVNIYIQRHMYIQN